MNLEKSMVQPVSAQARFAASGCKLKHSGRSHTRVDIQETRAEYQRLGKINEG